MLKDHRVRIRGEQFLTPAARHIEAMFDVGPGAVRPKRREVHLTRLLRDDDARGKTRRRVAGDRAVRPTGSSSAARGTIGRRV